MMNTVCYLLIFLFEQFVAYMYFKNKFETKRNAFVIAICYLLSFAVQFSVSLTGMAELNILSFLICNIIVVFVCFSTSIKQNIFNVLLLEVIMIATELIIMYPVSILLDIQLTEYMNDASVMLFETIATKSLYFLVVYIFSKISFKEKNKLKNDFSLSLFVLPLSSVFTLLCLMYLTAHLELDQFTYIIFIVISFVLLLSNVIVFFVHEKVVSTLVKNSEYQLEKQKAEINQEYYAELERQYDLSNILIHDIKKHLGVVRSYLTGNETDKAISYIDSVYESSEIQTLKQFSKNKLINVIVSRYAQLCRNNEIEFETDIRNVDFSFMDESDLTALLDNLLENAVEAAKSTAEKRIDLFVENKNEQYIIIKVKNTCDTPPKQKGNRFISSKPNKNYHGIGIKSIKRIAQKYDGSSEFEYDDINKTFCAVVMLKNKI